MENFITISLNLLFLIAFVALCIRILEDLGLKLPKILSSALSSSKSKILYSENNFSPSKTTIQYIFLIAILFRLLNFIIPLLFNTIFTGSVNSLESVFARWDAHHYLNLINNGYSGAVENGEHLFLVFFPLYVWIVKFLTFGFIDPVVIALLVSTICFATACCYMYKLVVIDYGETIARRAVLYISIFPYAFFFGGIMTESLFFLTVVSSLYYIKKHNWLVAGVIGIFSALTRMHGLLLIIPAGIELCSHYKLFSKKKDGKTMPLLSVISRVPLVLLPLIGTGIYLLLNYYVDGNFFAFNLHQEHWAQGGMWFPEVINYMIHYISIDFVYANPIFIPQLIMFTAFSLLFILSFRHHKTSYLVYGFATLILNFSLAWLLSGGRYMSCAVVFFIFLATLAEKSKGLRFATPFIFAILYIITFTAHLNSFPIM